MATIRPYDPADLGRVLALWDGQVDVDDALQGISSANGVALVADVDGALGGIALGALAGTEGRIIAVTAADGEVADLLLDALETALAHHGARTVVGDGGLRDRLGARGYEPADYLRRRLPHNVAVPEALARLGGRMIGPGLWDELRGIEEREARSSSGA